MDVGAALALGVLLGYIFSGCYPVSLLRAGEILAATLGPYVLFRYVIPDWVGISALVAGSSSVPRDVGLLAAGTVGSSLLSFVGLRRVSPRWRRDFHE